MNDACSQGAEIRPFFPGRPPHPAGMPIARGVAANFGNQRMTAMSEMYAHQSETPTTVDWLRLIKAEYLEVPGLCLTPPQVKRLWNLDALTAESAMAALMEVQFLRRTARGAYVLADLG
jgi:hypothetical protein